MLKRVALVLFLISGRAYADDYGSNQQTYFAWMVGAGMAGGIAGIGASKLLDGDTGWRWSKTDTAMQLLDTAAFALDIMQTSWFGRRPQAYSECNPILGPHPSQRFVLTGGLIAIAGHAAVSFMLPKPWRSAWQGALFGMEVKSVIYNRQAGVGLSFPW